MTGRAEHGEHDGTGADCTVGPGLVLSGARTVALGLAVRGRVALGLAVCGQVAPGRVVCGRVVLRRVVLS